MERIRAVFMMVSFQTYSVDPLAAEAIESCGAVSGESPKWVRLIDGLNCTLPVGLKNCKSQTNCSSIWNNL